MTVARWSVALFALPALALALFASRAEAQSVVVEGQVTVDPYGQPVGTPNAPAGYGVSGQVYVQPQYPQQQYPQQQQQYAQPVYPQQQYAQPQYPQQQYPQYQQGYAVPQQRQVRYEDRETSITALWVPGIIVFGAAYVVGGFSGLGGSGGFSDWMWVPLVGPWVALGEANFEEEQIGAVISGVLQAAGLTAFVLGLSLQRTVRVAVYSLDESDERSPTLSVSLLPAVGGGQLGLSLSHF